MEVGSRKEGKLRAEMEVLKVVQSEEMLSSCIRVNRVNRVNRVIIKIE